MALTQVSTNGITDGTIVNADVSGSAAIAVSKLADFTANDANNRVLTATGTKNSYNGEANLTYDGTNLQLQTDANNEGIKINSTLSGGSSYPVFEMEANRSVGNTIGKLISKWNGTEVASINFVSGTDGTNKDDGYIGFKTASAGTATYRLTIKEDGKVGIGTTSPAEKLEVGGSVKFDGDVYSSSNNPWIFSSNGGSGVRAGLNLDGTNQRLDFSTGGSSNVRLRITSDGKVGIGTDAPTGGLSIASGTYQSTTPDSTADDLVISGNQSLGLSFITLASGTSNNNIVFGDTDDTNIGMIRYAHSDNSLQFTTNTAERMRIDSGGRVGIGTTSPDDWHANANNLVISEAGNCGISIDSTSSTTSSIYFGDGSTGNEAYRGYIEYRNATDALHIGTGAVEALSINSSGYVHQSKPVWFSAWGGSGGNTAVSGVFPLDTEIADPCSAWNTTNYRFTAPVAGVYLFCFGFFINGTDNARISLKINGTDKNEPYLSGLDSDINSVPQPSAAQIHSLAASDYVEVAVTSGSITAYIGHCGLQGFKIG